jgi:hypothetical protein
MAPKKPETLLSAEEKEILDNARAGTGADFLAASHKPDIDADFLVDVLTEEYGKIHPKGLQIYGITVRGVFDLQNRKIEPGINFNKCVFQETPNFMDADLSGLFLPGCDLEKGLKAGRMKVKGSVVLREAKATGEVGLQRAAIGGDLECAKATFENADGSALSADGMTVKGSVSLEEAMATGEVRLLWAAIGGVLVCSKSTFEDVKGKAFSADGMTVKGSVFLREATAKGEVCLLGASIGGNLECIKGRFEKADGNALNAERMTVKGCVFLGVGFRAKGEVYLHSAELGTVFLMMGGVFEGKVDLRHAKTQALMDDLECWKKITQLSLDGFEYGRLANDAPLTFPERLAWLRKDETEAYTPHPYEQLAKVYKAMGHNRDARQTLMEKERVHRSKGKFGPFRKFWSHIFEYSVGFGYDPRRAVIGLLALWAVGYGIFDWAKKDGLMVPTKERVYMAVACDAHEAVNCDKASANGGYNLKNLNIAYPRLNPLMYSLDTLLPFVDFKQEEYWLPATAGPKRTHGLWVRGYLWFHIFMGWFLASMGVAGITGIVKKDN